ncbi:MAG: BlaI/MecI/CopY family transcriptional regulator, partial [Alistipes sp.]|nr:BlaI/MecI/CopY family transcriptional regulator [Alistipes sp.]
AKEQYAGNVFGDMLKIYFGGSLSQVVSFFSEREKISADEMDEILDIMQKMRTK